MSKLPYRTQIENFYKNSGRIGLLVAIILATAFSVGLFFQYRANKGVKKDISLLKAALNENRESLNQRLKEINELHEYMKNNGRMIDNYIPKLTSLEQELKDREKEIRGISLHVSTLQDVLERLECDLEENQKRVSDQEANLNTLNDGIAELIQMSDHQSKQLHQIDLEITNLKKILKGTEK